MSAVRTYYRLHSADVLMAGMVVMWGLHFIVVKDALKELPPLTFNALRFTLGLPLIGLTAWPVRRRMAVPWRDFARIVALTVVGPLGYQLGFVLGLARTTSTNSALLLATLPTWTALISLASGRVELRRRLLAGMALTLLGVTLVVLGRAGTSVGLSHDDLIGSLLTLGAAAVNGFSNVFSQGVIERRGAMTVAVWKYLIATAALIALAQGDLRHLSAATAPLDSLPNIVYSALTAVGGYVITHYALVRIGATRTSSYFNFNPIIAAAAGILVLDEPLSLALLVGGALTIYGVMIVRRSIFLRPARAASR